MLISSAFWNSPCTGSGFSKEVGAIQPNAKVRILVSPKGESDLRIHFEAHGKVVSFGPDATCRGCIVPSACNDIRSRGKMQAKGGGIGVRVAQSLVVQGFRALPRLMDAEVRARHLVAGFQIEGHGEVGGDP